MPPTHFETQRLRFRPIQRGDASLIFNGYTRHFNPTRFMPFKTQQELSEAKEFVARCIRCWETRSAFSWALIEKASGDFIGVMELRTAPPKADFGYILCESAWGKGYATEAALAVVGWCLEQKNLLRIWATCHPDNKASARVLEKAGLTFEARIENWEARPQLNELAGPSLFYALCRSV